MFFLLATGFQQKVHVVPTRGYLARGCLAVEGVDDCARFITFQGVADVVDVAVEDFGSAQGIAANHLIVGVTGSDKYFHRLLRFKVFVIIGGSLLIFSKQNDCRRMLR